ncbi:MAG: metabolite traffic protein EboE [Planctomycetia bacterium]
MRLACANGDPLWLAYGMNVHPGGSAAVLEQALDAVVAPLRARLGWTGPLGLALRLDAAGARELLAQPARLEALRQRLAGEALVPFTVNGFVLGRFHGAGVKDSVYRPSWREAGREEATLAIAEVLARLRGPGHVVSLSSAPGTWRGWGEPAAEAGREAAARLARTARRLSELEARTGTRVVVALEPEPGCSLDTVEDAQSFFAGPLAAALGEDAVARRHLGLCYDACHQAVMFEDGPHGLQRLAQAGIPVAKVQASCALELPDASDPAGRAALARFVEPTWLHQTTTRDGAGRVHLLPDLPLALAARGAPWEGRASWRTHFHVPVFRERAVGPLRTTQSSLVPVLARVAAGGVTSHLEVETYTWEALPQDERDAGSGHDLVEALARELAWTRATLEAHGARAAGAGGA